MKLNIHWKATAMATAAPRMVFGKISAISTQQMGPQLNMNEALFLIRNSKKVMDSMKINKVQIRNLQIEDYDQLAQSFTRVYSDGSDVFWTHNREEVEFTAFFCIIHDIND